MYYSDITTGKFINRINRFVAEVLIDGHVELCHVKNTGRCRELFTEQAEVYLERSLNPARKTAFSIIGVKKGKNVVNIDSLAPNKVLYEALTKRDIILPGFEEITLLKPEKSYGHSRFDFYAESGKRKAYIEVKGVTLEEDGVAKFPDAPTLRGVRHITELVEAKKDGYDAFAVFIVQMSGVKYFTVNDRTHKEFGDTLRFAGENGVYVLAYECDVTADSIKLNGKKVKVNLFDTNDTNPMLL